MELKLAIRAIRRYPVVFGSVALAIGLSVAVCTSLFSVLDGILFRPIPLPDSDRLAVIDYPPVHGRIAPRSMLPDFAAERELFRSRITNSALVTAYADAPFQVFFDSYERDQHGLRVQAVDSRFFPLLGISPTIGSNFSVEDERVASVFTNPSPQPLPIVIGHALWRERFAGASITEIRELAGRKVRIVGVMAPGVKFPGETNVWVPIPPRVDRLPSYIRLATGATASQIRALVPELRVRTIRDAMYPLESMGVALLFGSALLLLALTWVQVSGIVFLWASGQAGSTAIRFALGAKRWHLVRQVAVLGGLIAFSAFALAALTLQPLTDVIVHNLPAELSRGQYLQPDYRAFLFMAGVSLVGFALLGQAALKAFDGVSGIEALRIQAVSGQAQQRRVRRTLLTVQLTLTSVLLYLTGLAAHSYSNAITMDYGFDAESVMIVTPPRPFALQNLSTREKLNASRVWKRSLNEAIDRVAALPGVAGAATVFSGPLGIANQRPPIEIEALDGRPLSQTVEVIGNAVSTTFVNGMGATLLQGKSFDDPEFRTRSDVMLVNETLARQLAGSRDLWVGPVQMQVIGRRIKTVDGTAEIIGVIKDFVGSRIDVASPPQYFTHDPESLASAVLFVRTDQPPTPADRESVRKAIEPLFGSLPDRHFGMLVDELEPLLAPYRSLAALLAVISLCGLPIAAVGLTAAISNSVRTRRSELAVHLAIGAGPNDIRALVMREALTATLIGVVLGSLLGSGIALAISSQLFGVFPVDVLTVLSVSAVLIGVCGLAAWIPVRAASRLDPASILRSDVA